METLVRIKHKDPVLKQPDVVLFPQPGDSDEEQEGADGAAAADGKKSKPMYLRTVLAKQVGGEAGLCCLHCCTVLVSAGALALPSDRILGLGSRSCWRNQQAAAGVCVNAGVRG